jgi:uncharacterized protein YraI
MSIVRVCAVAALALAASMTAARADYVCGLNPYGDNFLSLRTGPGGSFGEIMRMGENTVLAVLGARGPWLRVRLRNGVSGWAHSRWICGGYPR